MKIFFLILTSGPQQFAKIRVFKVDNFVLPLILEPKLARTEWKKHPYLYIFSTFGSKINEFELKKLDTD